MMDGFDLALLHMKIHRTGEGCCCPGYGVLSPCCPTHKEQHADRLAQAERLIAIYHRSLHGGDVSDCGVDNCSARLFLPPPAAPEEVKQ